jgi:methyl-accepting chemotaxis protein
VTSIHSALGQVVTDLEGLNRSTERDFLAVGEKLMEFRSAAREISSDIAALNDLISGQQGRHTSQALTRIFEDVRGMDARVAESGEALTRVRDLSRGIRQAFAGLRNTVMVFRTLCTMTRIETSRLGGASAGFSDLADEVAPLSESIQETGQSVLEAVARLDKTVQTAVRSGSDIRDRQLRELPVLIDEVTGGLAEFQDRERRSLESSAVQAERNREVCEAIEHLVESIQFHDITRQQIEHVAQALDEVREGLAQENGDYAQVSPQVGAMLSLQSSQLASAEQVFATSIGRIERDLDGIGSCVRDMAAAGKALLGLTAEDAGSFFVKMEDCFSEILDGARSCAAEQGELRRTGCGLAETIGRMQQSVSEIRGIEIQIQRIAMNAAIRAAHLGTDGRALDVIAGVMQQLARESNDNTETVAGALDRMGEAALHMSGDSESGGAASSDAIEEMRAAVLQLHSSNEQSYCRVIRLAESGAKLEEEIGGLRRDFSAGRLFAGVVDRARGELKRLGGESASSQSTDTVREELENFASRYTMQTEREVHQQITGGGAVAVETGPADALGDNVELF